MKDNDITDTDQCLELVDNYKLDDKTIFSLKKKLSDV